MGTGPPKTEVVLNHAERAHLESLAQRSQTAPQIARRARIVLPCAAGHDKRVIARKQRLAPETVSLWHGRFARERMEGLQDEPRPGAPRKVSDAEVEAIVVRALEPKPEGATHWSIRSMAKACGSSRMMVSRAWKACGPLKEPSRCCRRDRARRTACSALKSRAAVAPGARSRWLMLRARVRFA